MCKWPQKHENQSELQIKASIGVNSKIAFFYFFILFLNDNIFSDSSLES